MFCIVGMVFWVEYHTYEARMVDDCLLLVFLPVCVYVRRYLGLVSTISDGLGVIGISKP